VARGFDGAGPRSLGRRPVSFGPVKGNGVAHYPVDHRVLVRYRVMAYVTGVLLIVLVFVGVPLQVWGGEPMVARVVGTIHGYLYLVYLAAAFDLTRKLHVRLGWMLLVLLAGTVPFCGFVAERKLTKLFERTAVPVPTGHVPTGPVPSDHVRSGPTLAAPVTPAPSSVASVTGDPTGR